MSALLLDAVDRPRAFYTLKNVCHVHCKQGDSEHQVSSLPDIAQAVTVVSLTMTFVFNTTRHFDLAVSEI
jgi:hypothetical protein